jgi:hypothetical protein
MENWGEIKLIQIDSNNDFWYLIDELCDDYSGFFNNRSTILEAYKNKNLYGLRVNETDEMYKKGEIMNNIFCNNSYYLLPCFCVKEDNKAIIIWTHTRARKMGFAKKLIELLHIEYAYNPLPDSINFWKKCNVKLEILNFQKSKKI